VRADDRCRTNCPLPHPVLAIAPTMLHEPFRRTPGPAYSMEERAGRRLAHLGGPAASDLVQPASRKRWRSPRSWATRSSAVASRARATRSRPRGSVGRASWWRRTLALARAMRSLSWCSVRCVDEPGASFPASLVEKDRACNS
jgi:hypothetical protein